MEKMGVAGLQEYHRRFPIYHANKCDSLPFDHQLILMKDHFISTTKLFEISICSFLNSGCL